MKKLSSIVAILLTVIFWVVSADTAFAQTQPEAGFINLEENVFYFHTNSYFNRIALRTSPARIWYVYQPADNDPASKPLFVFFNGGPGGATSSGLLSAFTGRNAVTVDVDTGTASVVNNPDSWTRIGNLLHIDMRTAGFSYSLMDNPQDNSLRLAEFDAQNYNSFTDGADFVRVLLRFLAGHPDLRRNRVVIVPESYGGERTTVMLHLLLYYKNYDSGTAIFQDPALVQEIQNHYNAVFPEYTGQTVPPQIAAGQFGHQIMIQPAITWPFQRRIEAAMLEAPGSIMDQLAAETGVPYIRWIDRPESGGISTPNQIKNNIFAYLEKINRDAYLYAMPGGFLNGYFAAAADLLIQYDSLCRMTGVDVAGIPELYASARQKAYKTKMSGEADAQKRFFALMGPPPKKTDIQAMLYPTGKEGLSSVFGGLQPWDRYFIQLNYDASDAFYYNRATFYGYDIYYGSSQLFGRMFLENTAFVETFITDAAYDLVVYSPAFPDALALHTSLLNSAHHDAIGPPGEARPGQILLQYKPSALTGQAITTRTIRFPRYLKSGHAVTLTEHGEMLVDVISWLANTGIPMANHKGEDR